MQVVKQAMLYCSCSLTERLSRADLTESGIFYLGPRSNLLGRFCCYLILINFVFFTPLIVLASEVATHATVATVDFVKGYATVFPKNDRKAALFAKRGMKIKEEGLIITGEDGFVSLSFSTGTVVNIQPSSEVSLDKLDCAPMVVECEITLNALRGNINSTVESQGDAAVRFTINTPYASAAVRGTVFDIGVEDGRLLAGVTEGAVNISAASGEVNLPENFGTQVRQNQPPSKPKPLLAAPFFVPGSARFDSGGELAWDSVMLAAQYLVSFDNALGLVYRTQSTDTLHRLRPLAVGTYAMSVRAIDADGLKGQVAEREFDVVKTDISQNGPSVQATINVSDFSVVVLPQAFIANKVELQFSPTKDFDRLINLDVSPGETVSTARAQNVIYVRARGILSNTDVTAFGPTLEVPAIPSR